MGVGGLYFAQPIYEYADECVSFLSSVEHGNGMCLLLSMIPCGDPSPVSANPESHTGGLISCGQN